VQLDGRVLREEEQKLFDWWKNGSAFATEGWFSLAT